MMGGKRRQSRIILILKLGRFHFLFGGFLLYCLGTLLAIASGAHHTTYRFLFGYLVLGPAHLSVSYSNDYFDAALDRFNKPTPFSGGSGILVEHPELKKPARDLALLLIAVSVALGVVFTWYYSFPAWFFGFVILGNALGWYYSAPPLRLAYRGLGELSTTITAGLLLPGMGYFVAARALDTNFLVLIVPILFYGVSFIFSVQIPDMEGDLKGGKMTQVVKRGRPFAFGVVLLSLSLATISFFAIYLFGLSEISGHMLAAGVISLLPLSYGFYGFARRRSGRALSSKIANANVSLFILFCILIDLYFLYNILAP